MHLLDLLRLILIISNLGCRKARVALTAIGVVIGTAAVVILVSMAIGLQQNANQQLYGIGDLSQIQVSPNYAEGPIPVGGGLGSDGPVAIQTVITKQSLQDFAVIPGVENVIPRDFLMASSLLRDNRLEAGVGIMGVGADDLTILGLKAQQGATVLSKGTAVIGAMIPAQFYSPQYRPGQEPPPPPDVLGQQVKLELIKWDEQGNEIRKAFQVEIVGILEENRADDWSMFMRLDEVTLFSEWALGRRINRAKDGYPNVVVKVSDVKDVIDITEAITGMGYQAYTPQTFFQGIDNFHLILQVTFGGVGAIAFLVAALASPIPWRWRSWNVPGRSVL